MQEMLNTGQNISIWEMKIDGKLCNRVRQQKRVILCASSGPG